MIEVFSSGGGTQSCAIAVLICQGRLPKPDFTVIADTGREMPTTWDYLEQVVIPAFSKIGLFVNRIRASEYAAPWGQGVFARSGQLMIPAYSNINGNAAKLSAFCSGAWKVETIERWFSIEHKLTRSNYRKWIGFSFDETTRILRMQIRTRDPHAFLHSSGSPLRAANIEPEEDLFSRGCPSGECFI